MKTNTDLIRVSKKAEKIVFSITDNAKAGISNQFQYTVILINGVTYEANSYAKVQKFISVSSKNAEAITAEHIAQLDAERAEIDARIEAEQKAERERDARYRANNREAIRERDREYRKKKAAARAAAKRKK